MSETRQARLEADLKAAMKARESERVSTLRLLLNRVKNERIAAGEEVNEERFLGLVQKAIKQHRESAEAFRKGGRDEQAEREEREVEVLSGYLPPPADDEELSAAIAAFVEENDLSGPPAIGAVMKEMMARFAGRADGATINRLARGVLGL